MVEFRPVCLDEDRDFVLEMFVIMTYETAASEAERRPGLNRFKQHWLESPEAEAVFHTVEASLADPRTIAEIVVVNGVDAGFVWATFEGLPHEKKYMELRLVAFRFNFQRQGLGRLSVHHLEELAAQRGALSLRSRGSAPGDGIRRFHASLGFEPIQTVFEKRLEPGLRRD